MSTFERALAKLREARESQSKQAAATIARVRHAEPPPPTPGAAAAAIGSSSIGRATPRKSIQFDLEALHSAGLLSRENRNLTEQYRTIKQPLLRNARRNGSDHLPAANLIMVASALAGEGKTFTCVNLSLSLASEKDWEVLLVDVDCRNPRLSRLLGVQDEPGLLELLQDRSASPESLILSTNIDRLSILPLGTQDEHAAELLASERMAQVCDALTISNPNRITVFDSSPLLLTTESTVLSRHVGQIVVVVRADSTPQSAVAEAVQKLDPTKAIGVILNRASGGLRDFDYAAYSAYGTYPAERDRAAATQ